MARTPETRPTPPTDTETDEAADIRIQRWLTSCCASAKGGLARPGSGRKKTEHQLTADAK